MAALRASKLYDDALIVIVSDHGESLGAHGEEAHGVFLYDETIHVPLLVKLPQNQNAGKRVRARASLVVSYEPDAVHLEIIDDGRGAAAAAVARASPTPGRNTGHGRSTGHGLVGMRERTALYDGVLEAGPCSGGGYRVAATLRFAPVAAP